MLNRFYLLEVGLLFLAAFLSWRLYQMWLPNSLEGPGVPLIERLEASEEVKVAPALDWAIPQKSSYEIVAKKNLFNSRRKEKWKVQKKVRKKVVLVPPPPPKVRRVAPKKRIVKKRDTLVLEGIVIYGGFRTALVKDIAKPRDGVMRVEVGGHIDSYRVDAITEEKLILKEEGGTEKILTLYASGRPTRRNHVKTRIIPNRSLTSRPLQRPPNIARNPVARQRGTSR